MSQRNKANPTRNDLCVTPWGARFMGRSFPCAVGRSGIGVKEGEGDGITPLGLFKILNVYVRPDRVRASGQPIHLQDIWSDDPLDPAYNSRQTGLDHPFSHERLRRADPMYDLVADLSFNRRPVVPGKGSAIFLHIWRKPRHPTEGCIAFARSDLQYILEHWTNRSRVIIKG